MEMKHVLVNPGGGFRGAVQVGAIKSFLSRNIEPVLLTSTSVGTLNSALISMKKYDLLFDLWDKVGDGNGDIITKGYLAQLKDGGVQIDADKIEDVLLSGVDVFDKIRLLTKKGRSGFIKRVGKNFNEIESVMDNSPLQELLLQHVKESEFQIPMFFTLVSLRDGSLYNLSHKSFKTDKDLALALTASSTIPFLWKPIEKIQLKDGSYIYDAVDGGLRSSSPLALAYANITTSFDHIVWAMNCNTIKQTIDEGKKNLIKQAGLSIDILLNEGFSRDIRATTKWNDIAFKYENVRIGEKIVYAQLNNVEVETDELGNSVLGKTLDPSKEWIEKRIKIGFESVEKYFNTPLAS